MRQRRVVAKAPPQLLGQVRRQRREHQHQRLERRAAGHRLLGQVVGELDQLGRRGVVAQRGVVVGHPCDRAVQKPQRGIVEFVVRGHRGAAVLGDHQPPHPLKETVCSDDIFGRPRPRRLERTHRHLVDAQRVGAVVVADLVGRDRVLQALADLAELLLDLDLTVGSRPEEAAVPFDDLGRGHVGATRVGVGERLDVTLVDQTPVGLARTDVAQIVKDLVPEPRIQQVQHRVLDTAHVQVDTTRIVGSVLGRPRTHPIRLVLRGAHLVLVVRIGVSQFVPRTSGPLRHDIGVAGVLLDPVAEVELDVDPVGGLGQRRRRFAAGIVGIEQHRRIVRYVRKFYRQQRFRQRVRPSVGVVDDREGLAPVPLPSEKPVAQLVFDSRPTAAVGGQLVGDGCLGLPDGHPVEEA